MKKIILLIGVAIFAVGVSFAAGEVDLKSAKYVKYSGEAKEVKAPGAKEALSIPVNLNKSCTNNKLPPGQMFKITKEINLDEVKGREKEAIAAGLKELLESIGVPRENITEDVLINAVPLLHHSVDFQRTMAELDHDLGNLSGDERILIETNEKERNKFFNRFFRTTGLKAIQLSAKESAGLTATAQPVTVKESASSSGMTGLLPGDGILSCPGDPDCPPTCPGDPECEPVCPGDPGCPPEEDPCDRMPPPPECGGDPCTINPALPECGEGGGMCAQCGGGGMVDIGSCVGGTCVGLDYRGGGEGKRLFLSASWGF